MFLANQITVRKIRNCIAFLSYVHANDIVRGLEGSRAGGTVVETLGADDVHGVRPKWHATEGSVSEGERRR